MEQLLEMLTYKRPNRSQTEAEYIKKYIAPYAEADAFGNYICEIGSNPSVMFSSHTDTVHSKDGKQKVMVDTVLNEAFVKADCLGADDGTGNWIMLEMIRQKIEGLYIFHRGEEVGGLGSSFISKNSTGMLTNINHAIAFDRAYQSDIINSQSSGKCCSDTFVDALAGHLGAGWSGTWGTFTDTANYNHLVSECTNLSVGYQSQHTKSETQDLDFAQWLRDIVMHIDWHKLPVVRDVTDTDDGMGWSGHGGGYGFGSYGTSGYYSTGRRVGRKARKNNPALARWNVVMDFIEDNPENIADFLIDTKVKLSDLRNYTWSTHDEAQPIDYELLADDDADLLDNDATSMEELRQYYQLLDQTLNDEES